MKNIIPVSFIFSLLFIINCSERKSAKMDPVEVITPHYDTTAIDSFSPGATSIDVAQQIRMSSQKYQDSIKELARIQEEEKRLKEELDKENKRKQEEEKKKQQKEAELSANNNTIPE